VTLEPGEIAAEMSLHWDDIAAGRVDALVATIDEAAEYHHNEMTKWEPENLERLTEATGNVVDASGRPMFDAIYEMFETIELSFEDDGSISKGFMWVMHPDMVEKMKRFEAEMTTEQRKKLEELIDRKREATCVSCSPWTASTIRSPDSANTARSSSAKSSSTRTCIGSATSGDPKDFSSGWPSRSANAAAPSLRVIPER
jgi:hypothetical protein